MCVSQPPTMTSHATAYLKQLDNRFQQALCAFYYSDFNPYGTIHNEKTLGISVSRWSFKHRWISQVKSITHPSKK